jgi:hypothetical protein
MKEVMMKLIKGTANSVHQSQILMSSLGIPKNQSQTLKSNQEILMTMIVNN